MEQSKKGINTLKELLTWHTDLIDEIYQIVEKKKGKKDFPQQNSEKFQKKMWELTLSQPETFNS